MTRAIERPTARRERAWRRSTTALWLYTRILEPYRRGLRPLRRRLEALERCLDESRSVITLERMLMTETLASRRDTATALRLLRQYHGELRARAVLQARAALAQPRQAQRRAASMSPARATA